MLETKEQKQVFAGSLLLILILGVISIWHHPASNNTDYATLQQQSEARQKAYNNFLASVGTDPAAQQALYEQILPPGEVEKEVVQALGSDQPVVIPDKPKTAVRTVKETGVSVVVNYLNSTVPIVDKISSIADASHEDLFNKDGSAARMDSLIADLNSSLSQYSKLSVPQEVAPFQNQELIALESYIDLAKASKSYIEDNSDYNWSEMYKSSAIIAEATKRADDQFQDLNKKYNLLGDQSSGSNLAAGNWLIPAAHAQFGFSLVTDIWNKAQVALTIAASTAVAEFTLDFLNKLAYKIQQAYTITNYLYYTDALVAGQYVNDYLNKYVNDPLDRSMIKNFIPALSCGNPQNLQPVYEAKAAQYLGFDPNSLDPNDPNYYQKLARVGNFFSSPQGWETYYQDLAAQANAAAQQAANNELNGNGNKSSRDVTGGILTTAAVSVDAMRSSLEAMVNSGFAGYSDDPWTAKIASQVTQTFLNNFVFKGTVLKEQQACIATPVVSIVTTVPAGASPNIPDVNP